MMAARAQQLPNFGFDNWKTSCASTEAFGSSEEMRQRPGVEPTDWNGSSVNQKVSGVTKEEKLGFFVNLGAINFANFPLYLSDIQIINFIKQLQVSLFFCIFMCEKTNKKSSNTYMVQR